MTMISNNLREFPMLSASTGAMAVIKLQLRDESHVLFDTCTRGGYVVIGFDNPVEFIYLKHKQVDDKLFIVSVSRRNRHGQTHTFGTAQAINLQLRMLEARMRGAKVRIKFGMW